MSEITSVFGSQLPGLESPQSLPHSNVQLLHLSVIRLLSVAIATRLELCTGESPYDHF